MNNPVTSNKSTHAKRRADSNPGIKRQQQRPRLDMNQAPRIPVRSTLASRSNHNSPTTSTAERLSNISASSITSSSRLSNASLNSNSSRASAASTSSTKSMSAITRAKKPTLDKTKKSIPTWDTKGRLNQLQAQLTETSEEGKSYSWLMGHMCKLSCIDLVNEIEKLQQDLESSLQSKDSMLREAMQKVADLERTIQVIADSVYSRSASFMPSHRKLKSVIRRNSTRFERNLYQRTGSSSIPMRDAKSNMLDSSQNWAPWSLSIERQREPLKMRSEKIQHSQRRGDK